MGRRMCIRTLKSGNIFEPEIKLLLSELEDEKATVV